MLSILFYSSLSFSMESDDKLIEFEGVKKPLLGWIMTSKLNNKHPFSTTSIIRNDGESFIDKGDILDLDEHDLRDITHENYVYAKFYELKQTRLSGNEYVEVGAIILGTKDKKSNFELHYSSMQKILKPLEENK